MKKILFACFIFLFSCQKEKDMNVNLTLNQSGNLSVTLVNSASTPIANQSLRLMSGSSILEEVVTDGNGAAAFNNILEGNYYIYAKKVTIESKIYSVNQLVQVISGTTKAISINPQTFVGTITFTFTDFSVTPSAPLANTSIIIFRADDYSSLGNNPKFADVLALSFDSGTTDTNGKITFNNVPSGTSFQFMLFNSTKKYISNSYSLSKGEDYKTNVSVSSFSWTNI